jgi:hypothetical protein
MRQSALIAAALLAGFVGGIIGTRVTRTREPEHPEQVVRARSFELVDETGAVISYWGIDKGENVVLAFGGHWADRPGGRRPLRGDPHLGLRDPRNQLASIEVVGDFPLLQFRGEDGRPRARLLVSTYAKPMLLMDDEAGVRVALGVDQTDTPGPEDNDWALVFQPERVWLGMSSVREAGQTYVQGGFTVNKDKVKYPYQQPKRWLPRAGAGEACLRLVRHSTMPILRTRPWRPGHSLPKGDRDQCSWIAPACTWRDSDADFVHGPSGRDAGRFS